MLNKKIICQVFEKSAFSCSPWNNPFEAIYYYTNWPILSVNLYHFGGIRNIAYSGQRHSKFSLTLCKGLIANFLLTEILFRNICLACQTYNHFDFGNKIILAENRGVSIKFLVQKCHFNQVSTSSATENYWYFDSRDQKCC